MLFNSYIFVLAFLPVVITGYYCFSKFIPNYGNTVSKIWLLFSSLFFYGYFNWNYLAIIIISILVNYLLSSVMLGSESNIIRKSALILGIFANIGCLFYYKYYNFFLSNINRFFNTSFSLTNVVLPIGISFFTFQQLSYVIDCYKREIPQYTFLDYALFVTFFPQLIAGPIVLHSEIVPQFSDKRNQVFQYDHFGRGLFIFSLGLAKKVLLADSFGKIANWGFSTINTLGAINASIVMLSYTLQIYLDFSGYSDMAIGLGYMFNISLPVNFNSPYKAITIADFWKRWHITLTRFFTTYVYIPLGGSRKGKVRTFCNIMLVFLISGLWHGANWTFIVWGLLHGVAQVICRVGNIKRSHNRFHNIFLWVCTFLFVNLAWVIFRADSLHDAAHFFKQLITFNGLSVDETIISAFHFPEISLLLEQIPVLGNFVLKWMTAIVICCCMAVILLHSNAKELSDSFTPKWFHSILCAVLLVWSIASFSGVSTFLYWNF